MQNVIHAEAFNLGSRASAESETDHGACRARSGHRGDAPPSSRGAPCSRASHRARFPVAGPGCTGPCGVWRPHPHTRRVRGARREPWGTVTTYVDSSVLVRGVRIRTIFKAGSPRTSCRAAGSPTELTHTRGRYRRTGGPLIPPNHARPSPRCLRWSRTGI